MNRSAHPSVPSFAQRLLRYFLAGVFAVLPLVITVFVIAWVQSFLDGLVGPDTFLGKRLSAVGGQFVGNAAIAYILGWAVVLLLIFLLGVLVDGSFRRLYKSVSNGLLKRLPLIGKVYDASTQLVGMLDRQGDDKLQGMAVVYCKFGKEGGVGVLALLPTSQTVSVGGRDHYAVLVPQSPVPIGGGLLLVPVESVQRVDMSVDKLMAIYVSMGASVPPRLAEPAQLP